MRATDYRRVLAFGAHPDDLEVGAGGLIARLVGDGARVTMVVASVPNKFDVRLAEARAGAARLGAHLVFGVGDREARVGEIAMHALVARFDELVAEHAPDLVITHGPSDLHWEHFLVHRATVSAVRRCPCDLLAYNASPDLGPHARTTGAAFVDITSTIETKLEAIAVHASQIGDRTLASRRDQMRAAGRLCGADYAEVFDVLRLRV
jgi:LmbE family N-acetylglucosaminyl deacetylase